MLEQLPFAPAQLENYMDSLWVEGYFSQEEVNMISAIFDQKEKEKAEVSGDYQDNPELRKSSVSYLQPGEEAHQPIIQKLAYLAIQINHQHFHFGLSGFYEPIQLAEYGEGDFFDWHSDFSNGPASTRKLSLSVQLSDSSEYEGGDLEFMLNQNDIRAPRTVGTVIIFPSFVLHRVTPITRGKRRSMVGWVTGSPFR